MTKITWVSAGSGYIAIDHKPGGRVSFTGLRKAGTTIVLTLLLEHEGSDFVGTNVREQNIEWLWFPFSASNPHTGKRMSEVFKLYKCLKQSLNSGNKIYIHCSGGIHRTGMITYGFLRYLGLEKEEALNMLYDLRAVTAVNLKDKLLKWADQFYIKKAE